MWFFLNYSFVIALRPSAAPEQEDCRYKHGLLQVNVSSSRFREVLVSFLSLISESSFVIVKMLETFDSLRKYSF